MEKSCYFCCMKRIFIIFCSLLAVAGCVKDNPKGADLKVGDSLPEFEVMMNDGTSVSSEDMMGGVSVVMFFHTSCPDCRQALPVMQSVYDFFAPSGVSFAFVSREEGSDEISAYWKENGLSMPFSAQKTRDVYELFASMTIPRIYISDSQGIIRYIFTDDPVSDFSEISSAIESLE